MKTKTKALLGVLALGTSAWMLMAQNQSPADDQHRPPPPRRGGQFDGERPPHPPLPIVAALDANRDGTIDADEIANASKALLTLDKNGDGKLTREEMFPPPPDRGGDNDRPDRRDGPPRRRGPAPDRQE